MCIVLFHAGQQVNAANAQECLAAMQHLNLPCAPVASCKMGLPELSTLANRPGPGHTPITRAARMVVAAQHLAHMQAWLQSVSAASGEIQVRLAATPARYLSPLNQVSIWLALLQSSSFETLCGCCPAWAIEIQAQVGVQLHNALD